MDLKTTLSALRTGWHLLFIGALIAAAAVTVIERSAVPIYEASASYVVSPGGAIPVDDVVRGVDSLDSSRSRSIMSTLTEIATSDIVLAEATSALGLDPDAVDSYSVNSIIVPEANVMETVVEGPDPATAAALASAIGEFGGVRFVELYQIYDVVVLDAATIPTVPSNSGLAQMLVVAIAIGLMAGAGAALLRAAWLSRANGTMSRRLGAYSPAVTPIEEHDRFKRVG
jgi:capsular polysaccharide biosynthesis protein